MAYSDGVAKLFSLLLDKPNLVNIFNVERVFQSQPTAHNNDP
jgi:hypothetical protein